MPTPSDYPARGKIKEIRGDLVIFCPAGMNYELHLKVEGAPYAGPVDQPVQGLIRVMARKVWTVPSGGNFIQPIFGPPKIIQGRVLWLDEQRLVVHAGTNFVIEMPASSGAIDLANGPIAAGCMVNVTGLPGATIQIPVPIEALQAESVYATRSLR